MKQNITDECKSPDKNYQEQEKTNFSGFIILRFSDSVNLTEGNDLRKLAEEHELNGLFSFLERFATMSTRRLIVSLPPDEIMKLEERALKSELKPINSLTRYWRLDFRGIARASDRMRFIAELNELVEVDLAYPEMVVSEPAVNPGDDTYSNTQDYLDAAPLGIDARWAWTQPNSDGAGVGFIDLEQGWFLNHEDLPSLTLIYNDNRDGEGTYKGNHGTAVVGQVVGEDNTLGIIGLAPDASPVKVTSHYDKSTNTNLHVADAIIAAIPHLSPGDVLLLEVQRGNLLLPTETDVGDFDAVRLAVALGIIVVEAAGNGDNDLDIWTDALGNDSLDRNSVDFLESGAIMVGAGESTGAHDRCWFSNYGSRIDCYAWGENIVTAGYGDLDPGTGDNSTYTDTFGGTSGASPIIVGAALILQGMYKADNGTIISPLQMREVLSDPATGTLQGTGVAGNIGVMPDLQAIIQTTLGLLPDIYMRDYIGDAGIVPNTGTLSKSPDIIVKNTKVNDPNGSFGEGSGTENSLIGDDVEAGQDNYIYTRVKNRGDSPANNTTIDVYWSEVSTLVIPSFWNFIGTSNPVNVPDTDTLVVADPILWKKADIPGPGSYCFIGVATQQDDPAPPNPLDPNFGWSEFREYVRNNNNIVWKNFIVVDVLPDSSEPTVLSFIISGAMDRSRIFDFEIIQRLPIDTKIQFEAPFGLFSNLPTHRLLNVEKNYKSKIGEALLGRQRVIKLPKVRIGGKARYKCKLLINGLSEKHQGKYTVAVRQMYEGTEVGRVTWQLLVRPLRKRTKKTLS